MPIHIPVKKIADSDTSDGFHTFDELYEYRTIYNAMAFSSMYYLLLTNNKLGTDQDLHFHKSQYHGDGTPVFGGGWFIVMATLPYGLGQISNHYPMKDWDLFNIPEVEVADEWDGHTPEEAGRRLKEFMRGSFNGR